MKKKAPERRLNTQDKVLLSGLGPTSLSIDHLPHSKKFQGLMETRERNSELIF
jgi:hypothetical protein